MFETGADCRSGKTDSLEWATEIFRAHGEFIQAVIRFHVKDTVQAEDVFQDFFLSLASRPVPEGIRNVKGYLYRAVYNNIVDWRRKVEAYEARLKRYAVRQQSSADKDGLHNELVDIEQVERIFGLIKEKLPQHIVRAIDLRYNDLCDNVEIAEKIEVNPHSVSRYISVGLKRIRELLNA